MAYLLEYTSSLASHVALVVRNPPTNAGDVRTAGSILGSGRSPGGGHSNPLHSSYLEVPWPEEPGGLQSMVSQEADRT